MRHVFILNPAAGKGQAALALTEQIEAACRKAGCDYAIYRTAAPGDATRLAREEAAAHATVRLYACGGDGTLLEVLAGITPGSTTEIAHIPCGSGNDFVRMFGKTAPFLSIASMLEAPAVPIDGICCEPEGEAPRCALNIAATGMDGAVAYEMAQFKRWPLIKGSMAYNLALVKVFFSKVGCVLSADIETTEGTVSVSGRYLFALCANGQYYGGGFHSAPNAVPNDGLLDFVLVDAIPRLRMLQLLPKYKAGTYEGEPEIHVWRGTSMTVQFEKPTPASLDGECFLTSRWRLSVRPNAYRFVIPADAVLPAGMDIATATV